MIKFFVGLDLGQSQDYTALCILERLKNDKEYVYHVRHLERIRGAPYPSIVEKTARIMQSPGLKDGASLVVDQTGRGAPVIDLFRQAGLDPVGVLIHGGDKASHEGQSWRVPKRDLVGALQVLLQTGRLKVAGKLKLGPVLSQEMLNFRVKIDPMTAHDSYSAWREADHDDLVLCGAGCVAGREWAEGDIYCESGGDEEKVEVEKGNGLKTQHISALELCRLL